MKALLLSLSSILAAAPAVAQDRAELWRRCEGIERVEREQWIASCTALIELGGEPEQRLAIAYYFRGYAQDWRGDPDNVIADYTEALRLNPSFPDALIRRGQEYLRKNSYERALNDFSALIRLDPSNAKAFFLRSTVHMAMGQYEAAIRELDEAVRLDPADWQSFEKRGDAYERLGKSDRALQDRGHAVSISPDWQTYICIRSDEVEKALTHCNRALELNPDFHPALVQRGTLHMVTGRLDLALADFDRALRVRPQVAQVRRLRGIARLRVGQLGAAIDDFDAILQGGDAGNRVYRAIALYGRGVARQRLGDAAGGVTDMDDAAKLHPNIAGTMARYGVTP